MRDVFVFACDHFGGYHHLKQIACELIKKNDPGKLWNDIYNMRNYFI